MLCSFPLRDKASAAKFTIGQTSPTPDEESILQVLNMITIFLSAHLHVSTVRNVGYIFAAKINENNGITTFLLAYSHNRSHLLLIIVLLTCIYLDNLI